MTIAKHQMYFKFFTIKRNKKIDIEKDDYMIVINALFIYRRSQF